LFARRFYIGKGTRVRIVHNIIIYAFSIGSLCIYIESQVYYIRNERDRLCYNNIIPTYLNEYHNIPNDRTKRRDIIVEWLIFVYDNNNNM